MKEDFIKELEYLALANRLKRVSDKILHSNRKLYRSLGFDIDPNWYLFFKVLKKHEALSVTEIANFLHFSHPSVISVVEKMIKAGYLQSAPSPHDGRKHLLTLTEKAHRKMPVFETVWEAGQASIKRIFESHDILSILDAVEKNLAEADFMERTVQVLKKTNV